MFYIQYIYFKHPFFIENNYKLKIYDKLSHNIYYLK